MADGIGRQMAGFEDHALLLQFTSNVLLLSNIYDTILCHPIAGNSYHIYITICNHGFWRTKG